MAVHAFSLCPTEGESTIRKDPRGDLTGEAEKNLEGQGCAAEVSGYGKEKGFCEDRR
jgi:hypothetical protein